MRSVEENTRTKERFVVVPSLKIPAELIIGDGPDRQIYHCELANLSVGGCSVQTQQYLPPAPQPAMVRIVEESLEICIEAAGELRWTRQTTVGRISCGFRFCRTMPAAILRTMIARGIVSRRDTPRRPLQMEVTVRRQAGTKVLSGKILDVSQHGLQICTEEELSVGERLLLSMPDGRNGAVKVLWTAVKEERNCCGCAFINTTSSLAIAAAIEKPPATAR